MFTEQQQALITAVASRDSSTIGRACAGTGKTTTAVAACAANPEPTYFVAFNKRIAVELDKKMPPHVECATLNSVGHRAWGRKLGRHIRVETSKTYDIMKQLGIEYPTRSDVRDLVHRAKAIGLVPDGSTGIGSIAESLVPDTADAWQDIAEDLSIDPKLVGPARDTLRRSITLGWQGVIDFDDQLLLPAIYGAPMEKRPLVGVDEAQDLSPIQHRLLKLLTSERMFAVGDPYQAIYGFRGAMTGSMDALAQDWNARWLDLTVSFRCPRAVTAEAQRYVPEMEPHPDAPAGLVVRHTEPLNIDSLVGGAIVCRFNKPLLALAFGLINAGHGCVVLGRDIGKGLERLLKKLDAQDIDDAKHKLRAYLERERQKLDEQGKSTEGIEDKCACLHIILSNCRSIDDAFIRLQTLFSNDSARTTLSSIHKAKGLEWERVYFLDSHTIPCRWATKEWELQQESNCAYVAVTRAKQELHFITTEQLR